MTTRGGFQARTRATILRLLRYARNDGGERNEVNDRTWRVFWR